MIPLQRLIGQTTFRLCLVVWVFGYILVDVGASAQGRGPAGQMFLANLPLLALGVLLSMWLARLMARLERWTVWFRAVALAVSVLAAGAVMTSADFVWLRSLALTLIPQWQDWALTTDAARLFTIGLLYTWTLALSVALVWSARISETARLNEARAAAFEAAALRAEAAALRLQLNPHFLFNTLNGIASLVVRHRQDQAEEMIGRLADFLRASLAADPAALVPLSQELETIRAYLHVEQARFGDRMQVEFEIADEAQDSAVPNFILQPLVENAIKHGVAKTGGPVTIRIAAAVSEDLLHLQVENGVGRASYVPDRWTSKSTSIGLANTRSRLAALYADQAACVAGPIPGGYRCELKLPARRFEAEQEAA